MRVVFIFILSDIFVFLRRENFLPPHVIAGDFDSISITSHQYFANNHDVKFVHLSDQNNTDLTKTLHLISAECVNVLKAKFEKNLKIIF